MLDEKTKKYFEFAVLKDKNRFQSAFIDEFGNVAWEL